MNSADRPVNQRVNPTSQNVSRPVSNVTPRNENRSEEHTSELQSLRHLVCRLLLEKKGKGDVFVLSPGRRAQVAWCLPVIVSARWRAHARGTAYSKSGKRAALSSSLDFFFYASAPPQLPLPSPPPPSPI